MDKNTTRLVDASIYEEGVARFMALTYEYMDCNGNVRRRRYPKVEFPFAQSYFPDTSFDSYAGSYIQTNGEYMKLHAAEVTYYNGKTKIYETVDHVEYVDYIHKPAEPKEMTLDEIEKALGYKVKVINKE